MRERGGEGRRKWESERGEGRKEWEGERGG